MGTEDGEPRDPWRCWRPVRLRSGRALARVAVIVSGLGALCASVVAIRAKQSQKSNRRSVASSRLGDRHTNKANCPRMSGNGRGGQDFVRNKPNSGVGRAIVSALWEDGYDEFDLQGPAKKQTQFPDGQKETRAGRIAGAAGQGNSAKQSQFPAVRPTRWTWNMSLRAERGNPPPYAGHTPCGTGG